MRITCGRCRSRKKQRILAARLRDLRGNVRSRTRSSPDLLRREEQGVFAFLGKLFDWIALLRRLQVYIRQANLKYRSQDVMVVCDRDRGAACI